MSIIASALKHMLAAGMPAEAILEAVAEMEANLVSTTLGEIASVMGDVTRNTQPRSANAERQAKHRAKNRAEKLAHKQDGDVTHNAKRNGDNVTDNDRPLPTPAPSFPPDPQTNPTPTHPGGEDARPHESGDRVGLDLGDDDEREKAKDREEPAKAAKAKWQRPDWIPETDWRDFEEMRRRISKPMSDRARNGIVNRLQELSDDGYPPGDVLEQSIVNCWQSVFKIKDQRNGSANRNFDEGSGFVRPGSRAHEMDVAHGDLLSGKYGVGQ